MIEIEFILNDQIKIVRCNENERLRDIYEKLDMKTHLNINSVNFLYNNDKINDKLSISQFINVKDRQKNKIKILVNLIKEN